MIISRIHAVCILAIAGAVAYGQAAIEPEVRKTGSIELLVVQNNQQITNTRLELVGVYDEQFLIADLRSQALVDLLGLDESQRDKLDDLADHIELLKVRIHELAREGASMRLLSADNAPSQLSSYQELAKASNGLFNESQQRTVRNLAYRKNMALKSAELIIKPIAVSQKVSLERIAQYTQATADARASVREIEHDLQYNLTEDFKKQFGNDLPWLSGLLLNDDHSLIRNVELLTNAKVISANTEEVVAVLLQSAPSWRIALDGNLERYPEPYAQPVGALVSLLDQRYYSNFAFNDIQKEFLMAPNRTAMANLNEKRNRILDRFANKEITFSQTNQELLTILREYEAANIGDLLRILEPDSVQRLDLTARRRLLSLGILAISPNNKSNSDAKHDVTASLQALVDKQGKHVRNELGKVEAKFWNTLAGIFEDGRLGDDLDFTLLSNISSKTEPLISFLVR
jgi:hypothetical protein